MSTAPRICEAVHPEWGHCNKSSGHLGLHRSPRPRDSVRMWESPAETLTPTPSLPASIREALDAALRTAETLGFTKGARIERFDGPSLIPVADRAAESRAALEAHLLALVARADADAARLLRIADDLEAHGRDEGGFSAATRASIQSDADFLRGLANG